MKDFSHIRSFENNLEFQLSALGTLDKTLKMMKKSLKEYKKLMEYYYSEQRKQDLTADERGGIPDDLQRGVLSEDAIYNMMISYRETALDMMEIALAMLKA